MLTLSKRWLPPLIWGLLIIVLSLMPAGGGNTFLFGIPHIDKIAHFGIYAVWTFLICRAMDGGMKGSLKKSGWIVFLVGAVIGLLLELGQYAMTFGRSYEIGDIIANTIGSLAGVIAGKVAGRNRKS
jgi:VanZ family protein